MYNLTGEGTNQRRITDLFVEYSLNGRQDQLSLLQEILYDENQLSAQDKLHMTYVFGQRLHASDLLGREIFVRLAMTYGSCYTS